MNNCGVSNSFFKFFPSIGPYWLATCLQSIISEIITDSLCVIGNGQQLDLLQWLEYSVQHALIHIGNISVVLVNKVNKLVFDIIPSPSFQVDDHQSIVCIDRTDWNTNIFSVHLSTTVIDTHTPSTFHIHLPKCFKGMTDNHITVDVNNFI